MKIEDIAVGLSKLQSVNRVKLSVQAETPGPKMRNFLSPQPPKNFKKEMTTTKKSKVPTLNVQN
jgi:hypothetical protein